MIDMKMITVNGKPILIKYNTEVNNYYVISNNKTYDSIDEFAKDMFGKNNINKLPVPMNIHTLEQNINLIAKY